MQCTSYGSAGKVKHGGEEDVEEDSCAGQGMVSCDAQGLTRKCLFLG